MRGGSSDPVPGSCQARDSATGSRGDPAGDRSSTVVPGINEGSN